MKNQFQIRGVLVGSGVMVLASLLLSAIVSGLLVSGILPMGALKPAGWGITLLACFLGAMVTSRQTGAMPLPASLLAGLLYLAVIFIMRGVLFKTVGDRAYMVVILALAACILGALAGAGGGRKRNRR